MAEVLFVCNGNAARSQYAEALYRAKLGDDVQSAGTEAIIGKPLPEHVLTVLSENGLNAEDLRRKQITENMALLARKVIVMADGPYPPYFSRINHAVFWYVDDPRGQDLDTHRETFKKISDLVEAEFGSTGESRQ